MKPYQPYKKEQSQIKGKFQPRRQKPRKEEAEFGPGKIDVIICKKCKAVYFYKNWHHLPALLRKAKQAGRLADYPELKPSKRIKFALCPACQMIKDKKYEGEIILEALPENFSKDIKTLAKNFGERAFQADPMDRVISIEEKTVRRPTTKRKRGATARKEFKGLRDIRILTTENQLAKRLAKKINEIYGRKLSLSISHSHKEDVARIRISF